jgi:hypothetical protein
VPVMYRIKSAAEDANWADRCRHVQPRA